MLEAIRKHSASIVVKGLMGLLILSFAAWGVGDYITGRARFESVASVGKIDITPNQVSEELEREINRFSSILGTRLDRDQARALGLHEGVVNRIVQRTLFALGADRLGVVVGDDLVRQVIQERPEFRGERGAFDRVAFERALAEVRLSEGRYVSLVRSDLARAQYLDPLMGGIAMPRAMVEAIYVFRQEKRVAEVVRVADSDMTGAAEPDEAALAAFHADHAADFTAPESRALTVVRLDADQLAKEIAIPETALKEAYALRIEEFSRPERRKLQQIVAADAAAAKAAHERLREGRAFADVAKEVGMDAAAVDLGEVAREELPSELAEPAFTLAAGQVSTPIESPLGWHIVRVEAVEPAGRTTFEEARATLTRELAHEKALDGLQALANRLEDGLAGGATLDEAAGRLNLPLRKIPAIDATGRDSDGNPLADLPPGGAFLDAAFATLEGMDSGIKEAGPDGYFVLRVDKVTPPRLKPLETVRAEVAEAWKAARRADAAKEIAGAVLERVKAGTALAAAAAERGLKVTTTAPFTRTGEGTADRLPADLTRALFSLKPGEAATGRGAGASLVAVLKEVIKADPASDRTGLQALRNDLEQSARGDLTAALAAGLRGEIPVSVNAKALDQLF